MVRIIIILILLGLSQIGTAQIQAKQIRAKAPFDSLYIMVNEQDSNAVLYRLGKWRNAYELIDSLMSVIGGGGGGSMSSWLLAASGTGGTETITDGETVTFTGAGINAVTRATNNVTITGTEVDGDITNEIQSISVTGTTTATLDLSSDATDASITGAGINVVSVVGNAITITGTEVDGSATNEAWTIDGDAGDTEVIDTETVLFDGTGIVTTTYTAASNTLVINATEVDGSITNELITAEEDNTTSESNVTIIDIGDGFDWNPSTGGEVDLQHDFNEFATDAVEDANEFVILWDTDGTNPEKRAVSSFGGADGNGIFDAGNDGGTVPTDFDIVLTDNIDYGGVLFIDGTNDEIGINTTSPDAVLNIEGSADLEMLIEDNTSNAAVDLRLESNVTAGANTNSHNINFYNTDPDLNGGLLYPFAEIRTLKAGTVTFGGALQFRIGYDATNFDDVLTITSRESGATDGFTTIAGGLRYKWTVDNTTAITLNTGYYGLTTTNAALKVVTLPNGTATTVGQCFEVFNDGAGEGRIRIAFGSGDVITGDTVVLLNEKIRVEQVTTSGKWAISN